MNTYENNVKLKGIVTSLKSTKVGDSASHRFVLAIENIYKTNDGTAYAETTWIPVSFYSSSAGFKDRDNVSVEGQLSSIRYMDKEENIRSFITVKAKTVKKL